jgi:hypothetical protein
MGGLKVHPTLFCPRAELGKLSADAGSSFWRRIAPANFADVQIGAAPEQGTEVRLAWNEDELRVLLHAMDEHVWATMTQRDGPLWEEEVLEVFLDPVGDAECYFEIEVNPLNAVVDLVCRRNRSGYAKDFAWDCEGLRTAVRHWPGGWTAELAIPFRALIAEPPRVGTEWRANFCRIDRPPNRERELTAWAPSGLRLFHVPERFGVVTFAG